MLLAHILRMHSFSSYLEHLITALFQLCWPLNAFYLFSIQVALRNPNIYPSHYRKCLKEGIPNICLKAKSPTGRGTAKKEERELAPLLLLSQFCTMRLCHFMGENSQTYSFGGIHKSKAYLNVLFDSQLLWLTWTLFPWEVCLDEGWLYCQLDVVCDTWEVPLSWLVQCCLWESGRWRLHGDLSEVRISSGKMIVMGW